MFFLSNSRYRLCELFGIPLYLDYSLIILLAIFALSGGSFFVGVIEAALLLFSITVHELGHALTARAFGYQTSDITLSLLGGCASLISLPRKAWQEFLTALAGPLVSFILSGLSFVTMLVLVSFGENDNCDRIYYTVCDTLWYLFAMNLMLGIFNLLPGFPLDGGRIFRSAMRPFMSRVRATYVAMIVGRVVAIVLGLWGLYRIFHHGNWGFVTLMIAWMIWKEGYREYLLAKMESSWGYEDFRARVSPPPYGGRKDECDVRKN